VAFALLCICIALLCFGIALLCVCFANFPGSPGEEKNTGGLIATIKNSCALFASPRGGGERLALLNQLVNRLRRVLGWTWGSNPRGSFQVFAPIGGGKLHTVHGQRGCVRHIVVLILPERSSALEEA